MELLNIKNLSFSYAIDDKKVLKNINLSVNQGEIVLICGKSGSGKTSLLKMLKPQLTPKGKVDGSVVIDGKSINDESITAGEIGFVMQNPDSAIITDKVWHELSFGLEAKGEKSDDIRLKIAETASFFGLQNKFHNTTSSLSGGEKQLLNLACVVALSPKLILLDEPTSRLDPIATESFINALVKLNEQLGMTIIITEHNTNLLFDKADKIIVMDNGEIIEQGDKSEILRSKNTNSFGFLPDSAKIFFNNANGKTLPINVKQGISFLRENFKNEKISLQQGEKPIFNEKIVELKNVCFRYSKFDSDILCSLNLSVNQDEIFSILGANGCGKSTLLKVICGLERAYSGKIFVSKKRIKTAKDLDNVGFLPQNPLDIFIKSTVFDDYLDLLLANGFDEKTAKIKIEKMAEKLNTTEFLNSNPFDLSGGEQQKCALGKVLLQAPEILLLDEPTKGLDYYSKQELKGILTSLKGQGKTIIIVTHDTSFSANISNRCALIFNGEIVSVASPTEFFSVNNFYTTDAAKISKGYYENAVTEDELLKLCKLNGVKND